MNYNKLYVQKKINNDLQFKVDFVPEINQKSYKSRTLLVGQIIKVTKNNVYFDAGLKSVIKTRKKGLRTRLNFFFANSSLGGV